LELWWRLLASVIRRSLINTSNLVILCGLRKGKIWEAKGMSGMTVPEATMSTPEGLQNSKMFSRLGKELNFNF
jgi:hypothetical protein